MSLLITSQSIVLKLLTTIIVLSENFVTPPKLGGIVLLKRIGYDK